METWGQVPSMLVSFLGSGNPTQKRSNEEYNEVKAACLQRGIHSQCVNTAKSFGGGSGKENAIKVILPAENSE